ncbi:hypothetical protein LPTSP2_36170 [Leptospira ellinghausenii]|uniref:Uncharacterized protein n=1 Tax=Leptospira ellinghausenii TaxID=1917822 RepID=A0A2P2DI65_9LEPT|nr:hypothetical protein [Leptospira ellinghausenii]GBF44314.1 hypothetical protein LPTSP2_36170 [Leptospira ellinghausenii]
MLTRIMRKRICLGILMMGCFLLVCGKLDTKSFDQKAEGTPNLENQSREQGLCLEPYSNVKRGRNSFLIFLRDKYAIDYTEQELNLLWGSRFFLSSTNLRMRRPHSTSLYEFNVTKDDLGILTIERNGKKIYLAGIISESKGNRFTYWIYTDQSSAKSAIKSRDKDPYQTTEIGYFYIYDKMKFESECLNQKEIDQNFEQAVLEKSEGPEPTDEFSN